MTATQTAPEGRPRGTYQAYRTFCWQVDVTVSRLSDMLWGMAVGLMAVPAFRHVWSGAMQAGLCVFAASLLLACWQRWHRFPLWLAREQVRAARGHDEPLTQEPLCP